MSGVSFEALNHIVFLKNANNVQSKYYSTGDSRWLEVHGTEENFEGSRAPVFKSSDFSGLTDRFKISFTGCCDKANNKFA